MIEFSDAAAYAGRRAWPAGADMGIYDREYYRDETSGSGWFSGVAPACKTFIVINVAVLLAIWGLQETQLIPLLGASGRLIFQQGQVWRLLTAPFLNVSHPIWFALEMWFFWMVGREMESIYGTAEFTRMYLTAAVFTTACFALVELFAPNMAEPVALGADGALAAVFVLFALYYPHREFMILYILPVQAWLLVTIYLAANAISLVTGLKAGAGGAVAVAFAARYLGGALYGYLYKTADLRWSRLVVPTRRRPRLRVFSPEARDKVAPLSGQVRAGSAASGPRGGAGSFVPEEQLNARLDEVLAKIAREGRDGLTDEEKRILEEASRRARDRRSDRV